MRENQLKISSSKKSKIVILPFMVSLWGAIIYQILVYEKVIPMILGGYITIGIILGGALSSIWCIKNISLTFTRNQMLFLLLLGKWITYSICISMIGIIYPQYQDNNIFIESFGILLRFFCMFFISYILIRFIDIEFFKKIMLISMMAFAIYFFLYTQTGRGFKITTIDGNLFEILYQLIALIVLFSLVLSLGKNILMNMLFYILSFYILINLGARSEIISILLVFFINQVVFVRKKLARVFSFILFGGVFILLFLDVTDCLGNIIALDSSLQERKDILTSSLQLLTSNLYSILFGSYGNYEVGKYIHNILSIWFDFGMISFILFLFVLLFILYTLSVKVDLNNELYRKSYILYCIIIFEFVLLKDYGFIGIPFFLGVFFAYLNECSK